MNFNPLALAPELLLFFLVLSLFFLSVRPKAQGFAERWTLLATLLIFVFTLVAQPIGDLTYVMFYNTYRVDGISQFFKTLIAAGFFFAVLNATRQPTLDDDKRSDYLLFLALSALGLMLMASAVELFVLYVALELSSYSLYAIVSLRTNDRRASEAAIKYTLYGATATALALFGLSYILASQNTSFITELALKNWNWEAQPMAVMGLALFLGGMFYKLALFPFHFWAPDVYQGTSNETAAFVATLPKLGAIVVLVRLSVFLSPGLEITTILAWAGAISMTFGNLAALAQKDLKRMLGFSSIAHAGYIMVGLVSAQAAGMAAASFYGFAYVFMNLLAFWVVCRVASDGRNLEYSDLNGLYKRAPFLAFALGVAAFSLVGLPPTLGFMGKFMLISSAWNQGYNWLVIVLALNSAIAIYYYLSLVRHAYTEEAGQEEKAQPDNSAFAKIGAGALVFVVLFFGLFPSSIYETALSAAKVLLLQ